jgi:allantoin racemase
VRILYIVPGIMAQTDLGEKELARRKNILQSFAQKDTIVDVTDIEDGPRSIESAYEEYLSIPGTVERAVQAENEGFDGVILGCFGDPGLDALREMVSIPVVGPGETAVHFASMRGRRFSIITVMDSVVPSLERLARIVGLDQRLASVRAVNIPVLELRQNMDSTKNRMIEESQKAIEEDKSDVVVLGCMSMAFMEVSYEMQKVLGIPVVNPAFVSLKVLEGLVSANLTQSKKAYPFPKKE